MRNKILLPIFYWPPISWFVKCLEENTEVFLEKWEKFPKQTFRNRAEVLAANGVLKLSVPVRHLNGKSYMDVQISYAEDWQKVHWKSIESAYRNSPYFGFYENQVKALYMRKTDSLLELNLEIISLVFQLLKVNCAWTTTEKYVLNFNGEDLRQSLNSEKGMIFGEYYQVFSNKYDFKPDLSILDLLFNLGPESAYYLKRQKNYNHK